MWNGINMRHENQIITIAFGVCFALALGLSARGQIQPPPGGGLSNPVAAIQFGGTTSSFPQAKSCAQALATSRLCARLADDSNWAILAAVGMDFMSAGTSNRGAFIDAGSAGLRFSTDGSSTGIDFVAMASGGSGTNGLRFSGAYNDITYSFQNPATGFTITLANNIWHTILDPAGTLATGTITMPLNPGDGMIVNVRSSQVVSALTVSPNTSQSIKGAPSSFAVGGTFECMYHATNTTWYC